MAPEHGLGAAKGDLTGGQVAAQTENIENNPMQSNGSGSRDRLATRGITIFANRLRGLQPLTGPGLAEPAKCGMVTRQAPAAGGPPAAFPAKATPCQIRFQPPTRSTPARPAAPAAPIRRTGRASPP